VTVVAAGIHWVLLTSPSAALAGIAGVAFAVGCHFGATPGGRNPAYISDGPYESQNQCFMVCPRGVLANRKLHCLA
jgi:hypothetical protein